MRLVILYLILASSALLVCSVVTPGRYPPLRAARAGRPVDERKARLAELRDALNETASTLEQELTLEEAGVLTRDLTHNALFRLMTDESGPGVETLLRRAFAGQVMDPNSSRYGSLKWRLTKGSPADATALVYTVLPVAAIYRLYGDRLSSELKRDLAPHLTASIGALRRLNTTGSSTSLCLMKGAALTLLGEATGDQRAADDGYALVDRIANAIRRHGIGEFGSPTYYWVSLNAAGLGNRLAMRTEGRQKFRFILEYLWTDIAANYFPGNASLAGPLGRASRFTSGRGALDIYLFAEGLRPQQTLDRLDIQNVLVWLLADGSCEVPDERTLALAARGEKTIRQRWDVDPERDRYHFITPQFSLGTANGGYGTQDRPLSIEFASAKDLVNVAIVVDDSDQPYGGNRHRDSSGIARAAHRLSNPAAIQEGGIALFAVDSDPASAAAGPRYATNLLLPLTADSLSVDGEECPREREFEMELTAGAVISVREGSAAVAIRLLRADGIDGKPARVVLKVDAAGRKADAARVAIYHRVAASGRKGAHARVAFLIQAAHCPGLDAYRSLVKQVREAPVTDRAASGVWELSATVGSTTLDLGYDLNRRRSAYRRVNGAPVESRILTVNGEDLAARLAASAVTKR